MEGITPKIDFEYELADLYDVQNKVAYLPGGYGGIGEAIAWGLAMRGVKVVVSGRSQEKADALAGKINEAGFEATGLALDVESVEAIRRSVDQVVESYGRLDILMNCVGIQREESLLEVTEEAYDEVYRINLKAAMFLAQAAKISG